MSDTHRGLAVLVLLSAASLAVGAADLWGGGLDTGLLLAVSRVPRTCAALLAGAGLALAGVVIQQTVQNRLVEPALTGTPEAYAPAGSLRRVDPANRQDYEAWSPE